MSTVRLLSADERHDWLAFVDLQDGTGEVRVRYRPYSKSARAWRCDWDGASQFADCQHETAARDAIIRELLYQEIKRITEEIL